MHHWRERRALDLLWEGDTATRRSHCRDSSVSPVEYVDNETEDRYVAELAVALEDYVEKLREAFPFEQVWRMLRTRANRAHLTLRKRDDKDGLTFDIQAILTEWKDQVHALLLMAIAGVLAAALRERFRRACEAWLKRLGLTGVVLTEMEKSLGDWGHDQAETILAKFDETVRAKLSKIIRDGLSKRLTADEIEQQIREYLDQDPEFVRWADTIALQEAVNAIHEGAFQAYKRLRATKKAWSTRNDIHVCPSCRKNQRAGNIPLDHPFPSGQMHPPAHPRCRCTASYFGISRWSVLQAVTQPKRNRSDLYEIQPSASVDG